MLISVEAEEKTGKTTFALTAPKPLVLFAFDMSSSRAIHGSQRDMFNGFNIHVVEYEKDTPPAAEWNGHDITIYELPQPVQLSGTHMLGNREVWEHFINPFALALQDDKIKTLVIDTATIARRVRADASLQEMQEHDTSGKKERIRLQQIEWGVANDSLRNAYTLTQGMKKNLISIHHLTDEYGTFTNARTGAAESLKTGSRILEGLSDTNKYMDVALRMHKDKAEIRAEILICGYDLTLEGLKIKPTWNDLVDLIEGTGYEKGLIEHAT